MTSLTKYLQNYRMRSSITIRIDETLKAEVLAKAKHRGDSLSAIMRGALFEYLEREPPSAGVSERQAEIKRLNNLVQSKKEKLAKLLCGLSRKDIARVRSANRQAQVGVLSDLWDHFLNLPADQQINALKEPRFEGMSWQSLLQANPFVLARLFR